VGGPRLQALSSTEQKHLLTLKHHPTNRTTTTTATAPQPHPRQDHKLRIYSRDRDPKVCEAVRTAFRRWSERQAGWGRAQHSTPFKFRSGAAAAAGGGAGANGLEHARGVAGGRDEHARASKRARSLNFSDGPSAAAGAAGVGVQVLGVGGQVKQAVAAMQQQQQQQGSQSDQRMSHSPIPE